MKKEDVVFVIHQKLQRAISRVFKNAHCKTENTSFMCLYPKTLSSSISFPYTVLYRDTENSNTDTALYTSGHDSEDRGFRLALVTKFITVICDITVKTVISRCYIRSSVK